MKKKLYTTPSTMTIKIDGFHILAASGESNGIQVNSLESTSTPTEWGGDEN